MNNKLKFRITTDFDNSASYISGTEKDLQLHIKSLCRAFDKKPENFKTERI